MLSKDLELSLNLAYMRAREKRHEFITVEHLLLALLDNPEAMDVLVGCGANVDRLRAGLGIFIDETTPKLTSNSDRETQPTLGFQRVLQRAIFQVQSAGRIEVTGANVLAAIFHEQESQAVYFLSQENITRLDVLTYISHGISSTQDQRLPDSHHEDTEGGGIMGGVSTQTIPGSQSALERYAINLNERAKIGKIDPLIGREDEVQRAVQVLCRRHKNNPLLVGEAGVGKTAIAEGLAKLIVEQRVPEPIAKSTIFSLDLGLLLAGTKYRGDFEKRFNALTQELESSPNAIVFIDEIHTLIGAGAASGGTMDASNLIKPLLAGGRLRCMGSTTYQEYRSIFEKDRALTRRFQRIDVKEPTVEQTIRILKGLRIRFEAYHNVRYTIPALKAAAEMSHRYITDRFLPDKAIDLVDEAGAYQRLQSPSKRRSIIGRNEIAEIVSKIARVPSKNLSASDKTTLRNLERDLKMLVFGQDPAIEALCSAIKLSRSGLRDPERPVGCFLFAGPTGVGKTEVSRQLANVLGIELVRFDMSEYMEAHTVSRLIGAPPGYVGYDRGGLLTEAINKHPHCVLLLDEIEKAHPDIFNLLLQIMDHSVLTDNNGRQADFHHVILIMTTNAGAERMDRASVGFMKQDHLMDSTEEIKRFFAPEFRNRLDAIIQFARLNTDVIGCVVDKLIMELEVQLDQKGVSLTMLPDAKKWLVENGYDEKMGARPMARLIEEQIKRKLADELLFGELKRGGKVEINCRKDKLHFKFSHATTPFDTET